MPETNKTADVPDKNLELGRHASTTVETQPTLEEKDYLVVFTLNDPENPKARFPALSLILQRAERNDMLELVPSLSLVVDGLCRHTALQRVS